MIPGLVLALTCECGDRVTVEPYFAKTKWGTLRLQGGVPSGWKVDGNGAVCPRHTLNIEKAEDTWEANDLRHAHELVAEAEAELERCRGCR